MKNTLLLLLYLCLSITTMAQTEGYKALTDSVAANIMNSRGANLIGTTLEIKDMYHAPNTLAIEITLYKVQIEALNAVINDIYSNCTVEELNALNEFVKSDAYKHTVSYDIEEEYIPNIIASAMYNVFMQEFKSEMIHAAGGSILTDIVLDAFAGTQLSRKDFKIKDKEFIEQFGRFYDKQNKDVIANTLARHIARVYERKSLDINRTKVLNEAQRLYSSIVCNTYYKYLTKEQMQYLADFYESPIGGKFTDIRIHNVLNMYANNRIETAEVEGAFKTNLKNITDEDYKTYIAERKKMNIKPFEPIENIQRIEFKKGTYAGAVINGKPHGEGIYTDKKGVIYAGNFVEGKMHGCITVYQQNGDSLLEMWANGKKMKIQSIAKPSEGVIKAPPTYTDENDIEQAMGYGYKRINGRTDIGMFVDDVLHGNGTRYDEEMESTGVFKQGILSEGTITETKKGSEVIRKGAFKNIEYGNKNGFLCKGIYNILNLTDSSKIIFVGNNINGLYIGDGEFQYYNSKQKYSYKRKGYYAYGNLFGEGIELYESKGTYRLLYEGEFVNSNKNGKGKLVVEAANTYNHRFSTNYEGMTFYSEDDKCIVLIEGIFKNDKFVEGKITQSCGSTYEGTFENGKLIKGICKVKNNSRLIDLGLDKEYEGEILNGYPHGEGKLIGRMEVYEGIFEYGKLVQGTIKNINGKLVKRVTKNK